MSTEDNIPENEIGDDKVSALYHQADDAIPPATVDATILAAARSAVGHKSAARGLSRAPFSGRWPIAISAAAVIVLAVLLIQLVEYPMHPGEVKPPGVMDEMQNRATPDETETAHDHKPASSPGRLYAPIPEWSPPEQSQPAMKKSVMDEESTTVTGNSSTAVASPSPATESTELRAQARLNAASGAPLAIFTPEMWLVKIQQLIDSGKIAAARDELDRFKQAHPDYQIDQHLLKQLNQP